MAIVSHIKETATYYCGSFFNFERCAEENIRTPIPKSRRIKPVHDKKDIVSPNKNTPSIVAVRGSAKESVTAVDESTLDKPLANIKYDKPVAIIPIYRPTIRPSVVKTQDISKIKRRGDSISPLRVNTTATAVKAGSFSTTYLFEIV